MQGHFSSRYITRTNAQKLFGAARWVVCPVFGRVGLAMLAPLRQVKTKTPLTPGSELCQSLGAFYDILPKLMPVEFPLYRRKDHAVVVFSDASWSTRSSCMGIVVWCPYRSALYFSSHIVPKHVITLFEWLKLQSIYICQAELLVGVRLGRRERRRPCWISGYMILR